MHNIIINDFSKYSTHAKISWNNVGMVVSWEVSSVNGQGKFDKHITFESMLILFTKNIKISRCLSNCSLAKLAGDNDTPTK